MMVKPAANTRALIREIRVSLANPNDLTGQANIQVYVPSTDGVLTSRSVQKIGDYGETPQTAGYVGKDNLTGQTEPTESYILNSQNIDRDGGVFYWWAIKETDKIVVPGGTRLAVKIDQETTGAGAIYATAYIFGEE